MIEQTHVVVAIDRVMRAQYDCPVLVKISPRMTPSGVEEDMVDLKLSIKETLLRYGDRYKLSIYCQGRRIYIIKREPNASPG